jgi:AcrR family transcriptional regulator
MAATALRKPPSQQRSRATVEAVLEAAAQVLEAQGLAGFNTNVVAVRAGVSIGTLYQYFPGKDAITAALARREAARFAQALAAALGRAEALPLPDAIGELAAVAVAHQTTRPNLARILDLEERRLGIGGEADAADGDTATALGAFLARRGIPGAAVAARDLLHMARGMIDGSLGDPPADLTRRVARAAIGYLAA